MRKAPPIRNVAVVAEFVIAVALHLAAVLTSSPGTAGELLPERANPALGSAVDAWLEGDDASR